MDLLKPNVKKMTENRNVDGLVKALLNKDFLIRIAAVEALGKIKAPQAVKPLIELLSDEDSSVRYAAVRALSEIGDKSAAYAIFEKADYSYDKFLTLALMGDTRALCGLELLLEEIFPDPRVVYSKSPTTRETAAILANIGEPAVDALISFLQKDAPAWYPRNPARFVGLGNPPNSVDMMRFVIEVLGYLKNQKAVKPLLELDWTHDAHLFDTAAWSLGEIGCRDEHVIQRLQAKLKEEAARPWKDNRIISILSEALLKLEKKHSKLTRIILTALRSRLKFPPTSLYQKYGEISITGLFC
ncbi:MAG: HEAT repeat domain-containing protein [Candidatus Bathyarchaeota archaeon]|nr:HEAT repeat domain-containing protein [Candidatus Bathyarchaeota archaeon]